MTNMDRQTKTTTTSFPQSEADEAEATESDAQLSGVNILPEAELPEADSEAIMAMTKGNNRGNLLSLFVGSSPRKYAYLLTRLRVEESIIKSISLLVLSLFFFIFSSSFQNRPKSRRFRPFRAPARPSRRCARPFPSPPRSPSR